MHLTLNHRFWPNHKFIIHNNASSSEEVHPPLSSHITDIFVSIRTVLDDWRKQSYMDRGLVF